MLIKKIGLKKHYLSVHKDKPLPEGWDELQCPGCVLSFKSERDLNGHLRINRDHETEDIKAPPKPVPCPHEGCSKSYLHESGLTNHWRSKHAPLHQAAKEKNHK
eukprot:Platyproteum_vivax@DN8014_c0_g1_i1.p1